MRPRDILAANIKALMAQTPRLDTLPKITAACGVSNGTLDRMRRAASAARIDELEPLAQAFGVEPWELLVPPAHRQALRALQDAVSAISHAPTTTAQELPRKRNRARA